jgi:1,4-alpha-glucan branching enzyme
MKKPPIKKPTYFSPTSKVVHDVVMTHDPLVINRWMNSLKPNSLKILRDLTYLQDFSDAILGRFKYAAWKMHEITQNVASLSDLADGYLYYGLHRQKDGTWRFREWAPNATAIYIIGEMNDWQEKPENACHRLENGNWEI